ncbi:NAD-dependent DNA ligase LigA [Buchnera aphidicola]|uniref:NAD-dependent DNA ligase LigA n=1 Tax=Buchnera aphidicola TaxID=9 RepID=UPI0031B80075
MKYINNIIKNLRKKIKLYEYFYHVLNISLVSDYKYDKLLESLLILEKNFSNYSDNYSPTKIIGENFSNMFKLKNHILPMLSLESFYKIDYFNNFYSFVKKKTNIDNVKFCCELKIDGVALNLLYKDGILLHSLTRGNGYEGEDITNNINLISNLPKKLLGHNIPKILEVRGEVFILKTDFNNLNKMLLKKFLKSFSNTRNIVSGALRRKHSESKLNIKLLFVAYGIGFIYPNNLFTSHYKMLKKLKNFGFYINKYNLICNKKITVFNFFKKVLLIKDKINFDIDGIVIKVDSIKLQKKIGYTNKFPKWAIAIKFDTENLETRILNVRFKIGRTGILTPVAKLHPINFSGVVIKNVSLHNVDNIIKLGIKIGSYVLVKRSGNVIPKIVKVISKHKKKKYKKIFFPKYCPCCKKDLVLSKNNKIYICINKRYCISQIKKNILHFFSKNGLNVRGIGPTIISKLVDKKIISNPLDVFKLNENVLYNIKNISKKCIKKITYELNISKNVNFYNFIYALGIPEIGISASKNIANNFNSVEEIISANYDDFRNIKNIGKKISKNIFCFFNSSNNVKYVKKLSKILRIVF